MKLPTITFNARPTKATSRRVAMLAAHILDGGHYSTRDVLTLAASCVAQSEPKKASTKTARKRS